MLYWSILRLILPLKYQRKLRSKNDQYLHKAFFKLKVFELEEEITIQKKKIFFTIPNLKKLNKLSPPSAELSNKRNQWIPNLNLTNQDQLNIRIDEEIDIFISLQAINLLQQQYPNIRLELTQLVWHFQQFMAFSQQNGTNYTYWSTSLGFSFIHVYLNCNILQLKFKSNPFL